MEKQQIFEQFKLLKTNNKKIEFLQRIQALKLPLDIKYDNLIRYYQNN